MRKKSNPLIECLYSFINRDGVIEALSLKMMRPVGVSLVLVLAFEVVLGFGLEHETIKTILVLL